MFPSAKSSPGCVSGRTRQLFAGVPPDSRVSHPSPKPWQLPSPLVQSKVRQTISWNWPESPLKLKEIGPVGENTLQPVWVEPEVEKAIGRAQLPWLKRSKPQARTCMGTAVRAVKIASVCMVGVIMVQGCKRS